MGCRGDGGGVRRVVVELLGQRLGLLLDGREARRELDALIGLADVKHEVRTLIRRMGEKKAIIFSTHILEEVDAVCTRAIIIARGKLVADDTPSGLRKLAPSGRLDDVFRAVAA